MYCLGDKYDIPKLKIVAKGKVATILNSASTPREDIINVIPLIYEETPESDLTLRDLVVLAARSRMSEIVNDPASKKQLAEVLASTPAFSLDVLANYTINHDLVKCNSCGPHQPIIDRFQLQCPECKGKKTFMPY